MEQKEQKKTKDVQKVNAQKVEKDVTQFAPIYSRMEKSRQCGR
jgi:hypothetical protein